MSKWMLAIVGGVIGAILLYVWLVERGVLRNPIDP
jgi:hypothetical protein